MSDRGMKKWAPFSSLIEQATCLEKMRFERNKIEKPHIASDLANKLNQILKNYHGEEVTIEFFYNGYIYNVTSKITSINTSKKELILPSGAIPFNEILNIEDKDYNDDFNNFIS